MVITFARVLELHLHKVGRCVVARHVSQPVVGVQLVVLSSTTTAAQATVGAAPQLIFHIFKVHNCFLIRLLSQDEYNEFQRHIEEDDFSVGILTDVTDSRSKQLADLYHIALIDITGEIAGESSLFARLVAELWNMEIIHKVLPHLLDKVGEHPLLLLASHFCCLLAPRLQVAYPPHIAQPHERLKHFEKLGVLIVGRKELHGLQPTALRHMGGLPCGLVVKTPSVAKSLDQFGFVYGLHVNTLCTATDGVEQEVGLFAYQHKDGMLGWLFKEFEDTIGELSSGTLGQPDDAHLIAAKARVTTYARARRPRGP